MSTEVILDIKKKPNKVSFGTVVVSFITDAFNPMESKQVTTDLHGRTLDTYLKGYCLGAQYLVKVNGKIFDKDYEAYIVQPNDSIVYVPRISGGGGGSKQILTLVAMIALTVVSGGAAAGFFATAGGMFAAGSASALMLSVGISVVGSLLINAVLAPSAGSSATISSPELESSTYSWTGVQTSRDINTPIPVLYGTHALGGTVINNRFYYKGSDDWMATQIALCHGQIEKIDEDDIKVDNAYFSTFVGNPVGSDGYFTQVPGTFTQPIMGGFSDSIVNNGNVSKELFYNTAYTFTSESTNIDFFRLHFEFPRGLYHMDSQGKKSTRTVNIIAKYRKVGDTTWETIYTTTPVYRTEYKYTIAGNIVWSTDSSLFYYKPSATRKVLESNIVNSTISFSNSSSVAIKQYFEPTNIHGDTITLPLGQYEFNITRTSADFVATDVYNVADSHVRFLEEINSSDLNYGGIAMLGINIKATDQLSSQRPNFVTTVTRKPMYLAGAYRASTNPAWICYDILTNSNYGMGVSESKLNISEFTRWAAFCDGVINNTYSLVKPSTIVDAEHYFKGALVIPETELPDGEVLTLSGLNKSLSNFVGIGSTLVRNTLVDTPLDIEDITKITRVYEKNIIDRVDGYYYYVYFNAPIKLGTTCLYTLVHKTKETEATPKLAFNGIFDTTSDVWTTCQEVAKVGRGQVILQGTKYSCIYDAKKTISGLYNAANSSNIVVNYLNQSDIASELEVQYTDKSIGYEMTSVSVQDAGLRISNVRSNKASQTVKGITTEAEALVYGRYLLATSKYIRRVITLDADIESITQTVGDLVAVQTDVTQYGKGGLVKSVIDSMVILDDTMYLEIGKEYTLKIKRAQDDFIKDYVFTAQVSPEVLLKTFNDFPGVPLGVIRFDDLQLIVYEESNNYVSTNTLIIPEGYEIVRDDRYAFGVLGSDSVLCIITDISRDGELTRKITAAEYNESILDFDYDNDVLQRLTPTIKPKNELSNLNISDRLVKDDVGITRALMSLAWDSTVSSYYNMYVMEHGFKNYLMMGIKGNRYEYAATELLPEVSYRVYIEDAKDMGVITYLDYTIKSFSSPPEAITDFSAVASDSTINVSVVYPSKPLDFSYYNVYIDGALISKQTIDAFSIPARKNKLSYVFKLEPVDMLGKKGPSITRSTTIIAPTAPSVTYVQEGTYIKFSVNSIETSFNVDYYSYTTTEGTFTSKEPTVSVVANWKGAKEFTFKAYDVMGNASASSPIVTVTISIPVPINLKVTISNKDAELTWGAPTTGLPIEQYEIEYSDVNTSSVAINTISIAGNGSSGVATFSTKATAPYVAGQSITLTNVVPTTWNKTYVVSTCTTSQVTFATTNTDSVITQGILTIVGTVYKTKSNQYRIPIRWAGDKVFMVRAVNTMGAISNSVFTTLNITAPVVSVLNTEVIDNNVLLKWVATKGSLPIENFMLYKGADVNNLEVIGEKMGTFTTVFENASGDYTYWMSAIDSAGNLGPKTSTFAKVNQPPDYILNKDWSSTFNGIKVNAKDEQGKLYLPMVVSETVATHFDSRSWSTPSNQVTAGYPIWTEPFGATGSYEEVFDYGAVLASALVSVSIDKLVIVGTPSVSTTIYLSETGLAGSYASYVDQSQVFGIRFRYVKILITVSGTNSLLCINKINVKLDSKLLNDAGSGYAQAPTGTTSITGNGTIGTATFGAKPKVPYKAGQRINITGAIPTSWNTEFIVTTCSTTSVSFVSTNTVAATTQGTIDQNGTIVEFTKAFVDIIGIQGNTLGSTPGIFVYDFVDTAAPTKFKVYLFDTNGNRVSGDFSWGAKGY